MNSAILIAGAAFIAVAGVGIALTGNNEQAKTANKRVKAVATGKVNHRKVQDQQAQIKRKQNTQDALKQLAQSEKQSRQRRFSIEGRLLQAGLTMKPAVFWIASAVLAIVGFFIGLIVQGWIGAVAGIVIAGLGLPRWILGMMVTGRQKKFTSQLADAIDVIVRGVKSGLPLGQCLRIIAAESPEPIKSEFQVLVDGQAMGVPLDQSLQRLYDRMPLPEVNFFQIVLVIQQRTGGNLSELLGNLSGVLRSRKLMKEKVKALSGEAVASAMIIGSLPIIVMTLVYFTKPDYIMLLFTHPTGHLILMGASVMMGLGILVMRNMVNFKF